MHCKYLSVILPFLFAITGFAQSPAPINETPVPYEQWASQKIKRPEIASAPKADYPDEARIQDINGACSVSVFLSSQGKSSNIHILHCTDPSFEAASLAAVKQYRFKPAKTREKQPVAVTFPIVVSYRRSHFPLISRFSNLYPKNLSKELGRGIRYSFIPEGGGTPTPDGNGVYSFTRGVTGPRVTHFADKGYGKAVFLHEGHGACDVEVTIDIKGRPIDPKIKQCERPELEKPALKSVFKSDYEAGIVNGLSVPMRAVLHLAYGDTQAWPVSSK